MLINGKEIDIEDINYETKMHTKREVVQLDFQWTM